MKIAVLGGGISGLTIASCLEKKGHTITLFEKESTFGGLCRTQKFDDYVFDLYGGHVFNSKFHDVKDWVFSLLPKGLWHHSQRNALIEYKNNFVRYPFELSLQELPLEEAVECITSFLQCPRNDDEKPDNFKEWLIWMFGQSIADKYMIPYNTKIWNCDLATLGTSWVDGKMPLPSSEDIIRSLLDPEFKEKNMPHSSYYYPIKGGIQTLIDAIAETITDKNTNSDIKQIIKENNTWLIDNESFDHVISTIPLPKLATLLPELDPSIRDLISSLRYNSLSTALFPYEKSDISWIYYPSHNKKAHRTVLQGNFSPEIPGSAIFEKSGEASPSEMVKGFDIPEQECIATSFAQYAYPVFDKDFDTKISKIRSHFQDLEIGLVGRFAEWKYYNMDNCIKEAFNYTEALDRQPTKALSM
jgi:protoporphyrinogen oxidase